MKSVAEFAQGADPDAKLIDVPWKSSSVRSLLEAPDEQENWLVPGYFAHDESSTLVADPKAGKTFLLLGACVQAGVGRSVWGRFPVQRPLRVLWADEEMGLGKIKRRLKRLVAGLELTPDEVTLLDDMLDIRPQQGFSFGVKGSLDTVRRVMDAHPPDLVVFDSLAAFQQGEENNATERRRFYNDVIAPIKSAYKCAVILPAHPPLPSQHSHPDSKKRARGSGDVRAFVDRNFWMEKITSGKTEHGHAHTLIINSDLEREGGSQERQVVVLEDVAPDATTCTAKGDYSTAEGIAVIGKSNACQQQLLYVIERAGGRIYQPELIKELESLGFTRQHDFYPAMKVLGALNRVKNIGALKGSGKTGDWLESIGTDS